ncbi:MAG: hypothetical protein K2H39_02560, partial [Paramuribaculum sp.]|nr:hypothetical protein [Paramuribaculum sp.]
MKPNIFRSILCASAIVLLSACSKKSTPVVSSAAYVSHETICMGVEHDGSQTLRVWGKGSTKADAIEQAKKNAVYDVLFKGIRGTGECNQRPLVPEVNARERYAKYFNPFFADGGEYNRFVKEESANEASRLEAKG